ncbi:MAG: SAM-dependent chlorinase/fluorinase [Bacteroidota bacterium]|nr:SAM-dependent chlorinase/fluorinase [Bacteroidota bacterium]
MAIITFTSDFGTRDHYVAAVKAKIFNYNPNIQVIDITHHIDTFNIAHGAFVLSSVFRDFPKGTVHLISVNSLSSPEHKFVAVKMEEHYFVGTDNGLFSLLSDKSPVIVELPIDKNNPLTFPEKNIFAFAAVSLASGKNIYDLGVSSPNFTLNKLINRKLKSNKNSIEGNIIHIDAYGNAITNISQKLFEEIGKGRQYTIGFGREEFFKINTTYYEVDLADCTFVFNDLRLLEIAINNGKASNLLGLHYDKPIKIDFTPEE